jgi:hypothetical protein
MFLYHYDVDNDDPDEMDMSPFTASIHVINLHNPCPLTAFKGLISISYS